jgi:hypothetical protein
MHGGLKSRRVLVDVAQPEAHGGTALGNGGIGKAWDPV